MSNAFITDFGYLSIQKEYLDNTDDTEIIVQSTVYDIQCLRNNITYFDNRDYYRWRRSDYRCCIK